MDAAFKKNHSFIYLWLCWVFIAVGFSLVVASGGYSLAVVCKLLMVVVSLTADHGLQDTQASIAAMPELNYCGSRALEHRLSSCQAQA